jgi:tetratricopeptide (TPR) repeat protein
MRRTQFSGDLEGVLLEAGAEIQLALSLDERDPWAHLTRAVVLLRMRRPGEAERTLSRALDLNPNLALAYAYLGWPLAIRGADEEALRSAEHALRLSPGDPLVGAQASYAMAMAHFIAGRYLDCVASARTTIGRYSEYVPAHYVLIAALAMQGEMAATAEALATVLQLRPDFSIAWLDKNMPWTGDIRVRLLEGWRRAGVPEE